MCDRTAAAATLDVWCACNPCQAERSSARSSPSLCASTKPMATKLQLYSEEFVRFGRVIMHIYRYTEYCVTINMHTAAHTASQQGYDAGKNAFKFQSFVCASARDEEAAVESHRIQSAHTGKVRSIPCNRRRTAREPRTFAVARRSFNIAYVRFCILFWRFVGDLPGRQYAHMIWWQTASRARVEFRNPH